MNKKEIEEFCLSVTNRSGGMIAPELRLSKKQEIFIEHLLNSKMGRKRFLSKDRKIANELIKRRLIQIENDFSVMFDAVLL